MPKTNTATTTEPTLPELAARAAKSDASGDHLLVAGRLRRALVEAEAKQNAQHAEREHAAINGTVAELHRRMSETREEIRSLIVAVRNADERAEKAQDREINEAMLAGVEAAREMAPQAVALWVEYAEWMAAGAGIKARLEGTLDEIDAKQAHAKRKHDQGERLDLIVTRARIRGDAAAQFPRPVLGASAAGPMSFRDSIHVQGRIAAEQILATAVHENAHEARRTAVLVDLSPSKDAAGRTVIDPMGIEGRPHGGMGRGVA